MTPTFSSILNLIISLVGAVCYFLVGWFWSASTWRHSYDLGWLVVAFILARYVSSRIESGKVETRELLGVGLLAAPAFILEFLADWGLHDFRMHDGVEALIRFGVFSCALLVFVVAVTAFVRFGVGLDALSTKDEATWRSAIRIGASAVAISFVAGTVWILAKCTNQLDVQSRALQYWFYCASLIVYFLLTMKMMLPLILRRLRTVMDEFNQPDMRF
jgi:uncharacterized membrane protein YidH (DUF202 family)